MMVPTRARMFVFLAALLPLANAFHQPPILTAAPLRIKPPLPLMCAAAAAAIPPDEEEPSISRFQSLIANTVSAGRRFRSLLPKPSGFRPTRSVAADGGDMWVRSRATREELKDIVAAATSKGVPEPIMTQFFISRAWLWAQWRSTIVSAVLPREVLYNICLGTAALLFLYAPGPSAAWRQGLVPALDGVHQVWLIASSIVTFTISFFLSQAYAVWRQVYSISRRVQGRLNDLGLLCAASAAPPAGDDQPLHSALQRLALCVRVDALRAAPHACGPGAPRQLGYQPQHGHHLVVGRVLKRAAGRAAAGCE